VQVTGRQAHLAWCSAQMVQRRLSNSEVRLLRLELEEPVPGEERGILELFDEPQGDADAALARDADAEDEQQ
jgi:hypothetical protein